MMGKDRASAELPSISPPLKGQRKSLCYCICLPRRSSGTPNSVPLCIFSTDMLYTCMRAHTRDPHTRLLSRTLTDTRSFPPHPSCQGLYIELGCRFSPPAYTCVRISAKADPVLAALAASLCGDDHLFLLCCLSVRSGGGSGALTACLSEKCFYKTYPGQAFVFVLDSAPLVFQVSAHKLNPTLSRPHTGPINKACFVCCNELGICKVAFFVEFIVKQYDTVVDFHFLACMPTLRS